MARLVDEYSSININVRRSRGLDSMLAQQAVEAYLEEFRAGAPASLRVELFDVFADQVSQRVNMLLTNGFGGLLLVLAVLYLFLGGRPAFWVAVGIPISFLAAMAGMAALGLTLNMISMFALIMGIGIIVDDAIVVSEHASTLYASGVPGGEAAERASRIMFPPVLAASLTTLAAFFPIMMIEEEVGSVVRELPIHSGAGDWRQPGGVLPDPAHASAQGPAQAARAGALAQEFRGRFRALPPGRFHRPRANGYPAAATQALPPRYACSCCRSPSFSPAGWDSISSQPRNPTWCSPILP